MHYQSVAICYTVKIKNVANCYIAMILPNMDPKTLKEWLKAKGATRDWLADQCKVSEPTVKGWLYGKRPITGPAEALILSLMNERSSVIPEFSLDEWERIEAHAKSLGLTGREWIKQVLKAEIAKALPQTVKPGETTPIVKAAHLFKPTTPASSSKAAEQSATGTDGQVKSKKVTYRSGKKKPPQ